MRVLVVGNGGREHALIRALKNSPSVGEVHVTPGRRGLEKDAICHDLDLSKNSDFLAFCQQKEFDLVVIGPEAYLADGMADLLRKGNIATFGPNQAAAELEASKVFAKKFMNEAGVPTSRSFFVHNVDETLQCAQKFSPPFVLKADGLAAGKGVIIAQNLEELKAAAQSMFEEGKFGEAGQQALLEEFQPGWELSYLVLTDGKKYQVLPLAQDNKRLLDNDLGPNTGGMGVVAPLKISEDLRKEINQKIVEPTLNKIQSQSEMDYRGVLYVGLMVTEDGPKVIEYNVRFGDPETQAIMPLLDGDWGQALLSVARGDLQDFNWKPLHSACVVLAAEGYPENAKKGVSITGDVFSETASSYFLHAGTGHSEQQGWMTGGGRVMNAIGLGSSLEEALKNSYQQASEVSWPGMQMRKDIGQKVLKGANQLK